MNYKAYKLEFHGAVHFGKQSLEDGEYTFCADTLFSALCQEVLKRGEDTWNTFFQYAKEGAFLLSDAFPYIGDTYYLPKPVKRIQTEEERGDSIIKKAYKKLKYIPMSAIDTYLKGEYDVLHASDVKELGKFVMRLSASVRGEEETKPYRVGTYSYYPGNGLYLIIGYREQKILYLLEELLEQLSFSGIGGRRASGLGRFTLFPGKLEDDFQKRLGDSGSPCMSLSISLPCDDELEAVLDGAEYILCRRGGFVASEKYAKQQMRKRDLYMMKAGSCFLTGYRGDIYDVSGAGGTHPVYRYAKPMFMEVDV